MSEIGVSEASALTGKSTATLYRWMETGKISFTQSEDGKRKIDVAELVRIIPSLTLEKTNIDENGNENKILELQARLTALQKELDESHERENQYKKWLNDQMEINKQLSQIALPEGSQKRPWWRRLFG